MIGAGLALIAVGVAFRAWFLTDSWFFFDDFHFIQQAARHDLSVGYLLTPYNGHLMPAGMLLTWVNTTTAGLDFAPPAVELLVMYAVASLGMLRLLCTLFGVRRAVLGPLAFFLVSPILIPATTWWAAGINYLPVLVAITWGLEAHVRFLRSPSRATLAQTVAWVVLGLLFAELTLLIYLFLIHLTLSYFTTGTLSERVRQVGARYRGALIAHTVLVVGYLSLYVPHAMNFEAGQIAQRPLFDVAVSMVAVAFATAVIGGPGRWQQMDLTQSAADPTELVQLASWIVLGLLVHASVTTRDRAGRAWLLPAAVLAASVALVSVSRAIYFGPEIALDYRFQTAAAPAMALALGLAFLPVRGARDPVVRRGDHWLVDQRRRGAAVLALVAGFAVVSTGRYPLLHLTTESPRAYFDRLEQTAQALPDHARLIDLTVPRWLWRGLEDDTNRYSAMFAVLGDAVPPAQEVVTDDAWLVEDDGGIAPAVMDVVRRDTLPVPGACPHPVGMTGSHIRLDGPVLGWVWFVRIDYTTAYDGLVEVRMGDTVVEAPVHAGSHSVLLPGAGDYDRVTVSAGDGTQPGLCVHGLQVGTLRPEESPAGQ